jgi:predicted SAM-dependent methyltransferase
VCGIRMEHILEHLCYEEVRRVLRCYSWSSGV